MRLEGRTVPLIVPYASRHATAVLDVIGTVFREYGATFEPQGFDADLTDVERYYAQASGCFVVLEDEGRVVGTAAALPHHGSVCELKRIYLLGEYRGRGHGRALVGHVLGWAEAAGYLVALAWSDARFTTAHGVYERLGFVRVGERTVEDIDRSVEYGFRKRLQPAAAGSAAEATSPCTLCAIAQRALRSDIIVDTARVVGIVNDVEPLSPGHCVVFPRRHTPALHDADDGDLAEVMAVVKRVAHALGLEHYNVLSNNGSLAGQTVFHAHVHLIPKWSDADSLTRAARPPLYIDQREISRRIKAELG